MRTSKNLIDASAASSALRAEIEIITNRYSPEEVGRQLMDIAALRLRFAHSIEVASAVDRAIPGYGQFNCYMYALNLHESGRIVQLLERTAHPLGNDFMRWLVETRRLKPRTDGLQPNDLILYSDMTGPKHAGRWDGSLVVSKWGLAHVWKHGTFEVPTSYGDIVRSYRAVASTRAEHWFADYLQLVS